MKKIALSFLAAVTFCCSNSIFSANIQTLTPETIWTGFYLGGNAGYWWTQSDKVATSGSTSYINPTFALGAADIVSALTQLATNRFSLNSNGFIGGGQVGYNYQYCSGVLAGVDIDFDGLTNSDNTHTLQKSVNLVDFDENYVGSLTVKQKINYLGTVRARLGYVYRPTILVYLTGGFAYGNVTLDTAWTAQESLGPEVFPTIATQHKLSRTLAGWTAGAGVEWLFESNWSARVEYTYYALNDLNASVALAQINGSLSPPVLWGTVAANTKLSVAAGTIRAGINYHFS